MSAGAARRTASRTLADRLRRDRIALAAACVLAGLALASLAAPLIAPHDPYDPRQLDIMDAELPPLWQTDGDPRFLLGTDAQGRDMLSAILYGTGISLVIGLLAVLLQAVIGITVGLLSGYAAGPPVLPPQPPHGAPKDSIFRPLRPPH